MADESTDTPTSSSRQSHQPSTKSSLIDRVEYKKSNGDIMEKYKKLTEDIKMREKKVNEKDFKGESQEDK